MDNSRKFSTERLANIRRIRKARRLYRQVPLFAQLLMAEKYPGYDDKQFCDDLRRRSKAKPRRKKSTLQRFGRYHRMIQLIRDYKESRDTSLLIEAATLRRNMTKPYRVRVRLGKRIYEFSFPPTVSILQIEALTARFGTCKTPEEIDTVYNEFITY